MRKGFYTRRTNLRIQEFNLDFGSVSFHLKVSTDLVETSRDVSPHDGFTTRCFGLEVFSESHVTMFRCACLGLFSEEINRVAIKVAFDPQLNL